MSTDERKVYKIIYYGLKSRTYNIVVPSFLPVDTIQEIYLRVLYDTPLFYYVNQTVIRMQGSLGNWVLLPEYLYTQNEIKQIDKELKSIVNKIKKKADQFKNNEFRLEKCLHDSVVKSVAYDYESLKKSDCFNAHSIVGAFIDRKAVCEGIANCYNVVVCTDRIEIPLVPNGFIYLLLHKCLDELHNIAAIATRSPCPRCREFVGISTKNH